MTIVVLDDDGKEVVRLDPFRAGQTFYEGLIHAIRVETYEMRTAIELLERKRANTLFKTPAIDEPREVEPTICPEICPEI